MWTVPAQPAQRADLAIDESRIAEIGAVTGAATRTIDAAGLIVAPGFIDPHTHYDAQICWDPLVTCSSWHGVTTVIMGNCGVGLAPCKPAEHDVATWNLVHVEAIPYDVLNRGTHLGLGNLSRIHRRRPAPRRRHQRRLSGGAVALSSLGDGRRGDGPRGHARRDRAISGLLDEAVAAGAFGFSLTVMPQHLGYKGQPLACRLASDDELRSYSRSCASKIAA